MGTLLRASIHLTGGHLVYSLDDPYIHMAMARSLAEHNVWGLTPNAFTSSTSSPIWTFLLGVAFRIFGSQVWIPFALNVAFALALMAVAHIILTSYSIAGAPRLVALAGIFVFATIPTLVFTGMEHVLQIILVLLFCHQMITLLSSDSDQPRFRTFVLAVSALALPLIRYEDLFVIASAALICLLRGRWKLALLFLGPALLGIGVYGAWAVSNGWYWLPNSLIVKSHVDPGSAVTSVFRTFTLIGIRLQTAFHLASLMTFSCGILIYRWFKKERWAKDSILHALFLMSAAFHLAFVRVVTALPPDRYQAYLIGMAILALSVTTAGSTDKAACGKYYQLSDRDKRAFRLGAIALGIVCVAILLLDMEVRSRYQWSFLWIRFADMLSIPILLLCLRFASRPQDILSDRGIMIRRLAYMAVLFLAIVPLYDRGIMYLQMIPRSTCNVYEQQIQMARFVQKYYKGKSVAANDVGAISYFADTDCLDLVGLASMEIARPRCKGELTAERLEQIAQSKRVEIAAIYDRWFQNNLPSTWSKVGAWAIQSNIVCGDSTVSFYATGPAADATLKANLAAFSTELPKSVIQSGKYL